MCGAASLSSAAAAAAVHRVFAACQVAACLTPLPLAGALRDPPREDQCTAAVSFFLLGLGLLLPLLWQALSEARLFQQHQRERAAEGLPPEGGAEAAVYGFWWNLTFEGMGLQVLLVCWILLSALWDQTSYLVRSDGGVADAAVL